MEKYSLKLNQVSKTFGTQSQPFTALKRVTLEVEQGEYLAIVGKSGSGKSTLLNMITGIDKPTEGEVLVQGQAIHKLNESKLATWRGQHIGIVFQFFQLIPTLTIAENLLLAMEFVNKIPITERKARVAALLDSVGISAQANKLPALLSGGEQQRAAIARALANDPDIIVADEPTGNLDSKTAVAVNALLRGLSRKGKTVIVVTHAADAEKEYDRVVSIADGVVLPAKTLVR